MTLVLLFIAITFKYSLMIVLQGNLMPEIDLQVEIPAPHIIITFLPETKLILAIMIILPYQQGLLERQPNLFQ